MDTVDPGVLYAEGCAQGRAGGGVVILDFGRPDYSGGTLLHDDSTHASIVDIKIAVENFAWGVWDNN
jgi:hypothetical protein